MALGILKIKLVAEIWEFIKRFRIAKVTILSFSKIASAAIEIVNTKLGKMGLIAAGVFAAMAAGALLLRSQLKPAIELQKDMANVATLLRDEAGQAFSFVNKWVKTFTQNVINLSAEFGETAAATAKGLYDILSATIPASDALNVLIVSMRAARAGLTSTATATKAIISVLMAYNMSFDQAAKVSDVFFATIRRGVTTFKELAPVIGRATATAAAAGVSFEELMAAVTTMTRAGLDTGVAITSINQTLLQFFRPTEDAVKAAARLGLNLDLTTLQTEGLVSVMEKLSDLLPQQVGQMFRQMRALRGVNALIQQVSGFAEDYNVMLHAAGETQAAFEKQAKAMAFSLDRLKQNFNALRTQAALPWLGTVKRLVEGLNSLMGVLRKITPAVAQFSGDLLFAGAAAAGLTAAVTLTIAILKTLGIAFAPFLLLVAKFALIAAAIFVVVKALISLEKELQLLSGALDVFYRTITLGIAGLEDVTAAVKLLGNSFKWLLRQIGLVREEWSELAASRELASALKALTEEVDNSVKPTDELRDRWQSVIESLQRGAPMTLEVKKALDDLGATLKNTPVYTDATKEGLLELIDAVGEVGRVTPGTKARIAEISAELAAGKKSGSDYVQMWVRLLDGISEGDMLTDNFRKSLVSMYTELSNSKDVSAGLKQQISELVSELLNTANVSDVVRAKMREMQRAFNEGRATTARLKASFEILGMDMPQHLAAIAKEADWAFNTIWRDGGYSAEKLSKIWVEGFVPKLMNAFGKIPEKYRALTLRMTGYTLEMIQALSTLDVDMPSKLQKEARAAAAALLILIQENRRLPEDARLSAKVIGDAWEEVVEKIERAFGRVPPEFNALAQEIASISAATLNNFRALGEEPLDILRTKADSMLKAFEALYNLRASGELNIDESQIRDLWEGVRKAIEEAYGAFPEELLDRIRELQELSSKVMGSPKLVADMRQQFAELAVQLEVEMDKLPPAAQEMWRKMVLIPEIEQQAALNTWKDFIDRIEEGMTVKEWETYKRLKPMIKGWERAFKDIRNLEDVSAEDRSKAFTKLLSQIEVAGGKYTDVWRRVYSALQLVNESQVRSFEEIVKDVSVEIRRELSNAFVDLYEELFEQSRKSLTLVQMEADERKRSLRDQLVEGKVTTARYYQELAELDRQYTEEKKKYMNSFQKFYVTIWDGMKKYWIKLLSEMLAEWITQQLKMMAMSLKRAIVEIAADSAAAKTGAVKSAAGIPFPLNLVAIGAAVAAVTAILASVTKFAAGGIVTKPMLGIIGEAGPEAIIPLGHPSARGLGGARSITVHYNDQFVFEGPSMVDDQEGWDRIYRDKVLPAKRRNLEELRDIAGESVE